MKSGSGWRGWGGVEARKNEAAQWKHFIAKGADPFRPSSIPLRVQHKKSLLKCRP